MKAKYMQQNLQQATGRTPTIEELAAALEVELEDLVQALDAGSEVESLHAVVHQGDGSPVYLLDKLGSGGSAGYEDGLIDKIALREVITKLDARERQVIVMRYFQDKTQSQIAKDIGVSQVQVSRIEKRVLKILREKLTP
ncbi:MAG: sigma-70 family RNA polymerase sigma factor, partial [Defluviitaleaceae bacterium]|nr:sigma-70 family RNA polymerase sigma factor [Defluviitaleaceae bacterium]